MNQLRVVIGADHGGYEMKMQLVERLKGEFQVSDVGAHVFEAADDYPDFSYQVAQAIASGQADRGILICGSGVGASIAANKVPGVRASLCHDTYSAHQGVEHDNMNVICLGARVVGPELAFELVSAFLHAKFNGDERFRRRLAKIASIEREALKAQSEGR